MSDPTGTEPEVEGVDEQNCQRCGNSVNESGFRLSIIEGDHVRVRTETGPLDRNLWRAHTHIGYYCSVECLARTQVAALEMLSAALPGPNVRMSLGE